MNSPKLITTEVRKLNPSLLGSQAERDAFVDQKLMEERMNERLTAYLLDLAELAERAEQYRERMAFADLEADSALESRVHHNTRNDWKGQ